MAARTPKTAATTDEGTQATSATSWGTLAKAEYVSPIGHIPGEVIRAFTDTLASYGQEVATPTLLLAANTPKTRTFEAATEQEAELLAEWAEVWSMHQPTPVVGFVSTEGTSVSFSFAPKTAKAAKGALRDDTAEIRVWALAQNLDVKDRGRIAQKVIDAYDARGQA